MVSITDDMKKKGTAIIIGVFMALVYYQLGSIAFLKTVLFMFLTAMALKKPIYGVMLFVFVLPFVSNTNLLFVGLYISAIYFIGLLYRGELEFKASPLNYTIIIFVLLVVLNTIFSVDVKGSLRDFSVHWMSFLVIFALINSSKNPQDLKNLSAAFVFAAFLVSLYGIFQYITGVEMESGWVDISTSPNIRTRVFSTFENPNLLAEYLLMAIPIAFGLALSTKNKLKRFLYSLGGTTMVIAIIMTYSRGGWVGLAVGIIVFLLLTNIKILIGLIPVAAISVMFLPQTILQRISTIGSLQDSSNFYRYQLWNMSIDILKDFWISGVGLGHLPFMRISGYYITNMAPYHTHNTYLQIAIEMGIIGLLALMMLVIVGIKTGLTIVVREKNNTNRILTSGYIAALVGIMVHGFVEHVLYSPKIITTFWFVIAMISSYYIVYKDKKTEEISAIGREC